MASTDPRTRRPSQFTFEPAPLPSDQRQVGQYRLLHRLGSSQFATMFLASAPWGPLVAIKRIHPALLEDRRFASVFERELVLAGKVAHPNICTVYGIERDGGETYVVTEYVHGESIAAIIAGDRVFPEQMALHLIGQACLGLQATHGLTNEQGERLVLVHGDLSPANLLVSYDGELKVVDFGIESAAAKSAAVSRGQVSYLAPEQLSANGAEPATDVFVLGAVLYELLTGVRAFPNTGDEDTARRIQAGQYPSPLQHRPDLSEQTEAIVTRALQPDVAQRYPSAAAMYRDVYAVLIRSQNGIAAKQIGERLRRTFARRYAVREEIRSLAFRAPDVLEDEELSIDESVMHDQVRCDFCGHVAADAEALKAHGESCGQQKWWKHNFGGARSGAVTGDAEDLRRRASRPAVRPRVDKPATTSLWQRFRQKLGGGGKQDTLSARLETVDARLTQVRDPGVSGLTTQAMDALWKTADVLFEEKFASSVPLDRVKPLITRCANALLAIALQIEGNEAFLADNSVRDLRGEVEHLAHRIDTADKPHVRAELERSAQRKRELLEETEALISANEVLRLRLEAVVDMICVSQGRVLKAFAGYGDRAVANAQDSVAAIMTEVETLNEAADEVEQALTPEEP